MSSGIYSALSGAVGQERNLAVVANNMANVNTTGYKADVVSFNEVVMKQAEGEPERNMAFKYSQLTRVNADLNPGPLAETGRPLDWALHGEMFFSVRGPEGTRYTRAGSFVQDADGVVRTQGGDAVLLEGGPQDPEGKELRIPRNAKAISLASDGTVRADQATLGNLRVRTFSEPDKLEKVGTVEFVPTDGMEPIQPENYAVVQGSLEQPNFNAVQGLHQVINVNRAFDALQKIIRTFHTVDERTAKGFGA